MNVIEHPTFKAAETTTSFIDDNQQLFTLPPSRNRAQKLLNYMANTLVNGPSTPFVTPYPPSDAEAVMPEISDSKKASLSLLVLLHHTNKCPLLLLPNPSDYPFDGENLS